MLIRIVMISFLVSCSFFGHSQSPFYHYFHDTIKPGYRISGSFDSIDVAIASTQTTLPTLHTPSQQLFEPSNWYKTSVLADKTTRYSTIPHVGLYYSFGSNTAQQAGISYTQALSANQFAQMDYKRISTAGAIRNATLENNRLSLAHLIRTKRYASQLHVLFDGTNKGLNGGLIGDTIEDPTQPIEFNAVKKSDATFRERQFEADLWQFFSFTKDSLLKTGLYVRPRFTIRNRRFQETGDIVGIYGVANIHPNNTNDYWERSELEGTAGYFFHTRLLSVNAGLFVRYWDFDNLSRHTDTVETGLSADLTVKLNTRLVLRASGALTLAGAIGEKELTTVLNYAKNFIGLSGSLLFTQKFPELYQRAYFSNVAAYDWQNQQLITTSAIRFQAASSWRFLPVKVKLDAINVQNNPFFLANSWRQDTLTSLSVFSLRIHGDLKWRSLLFQPELRFQQSTLDWMPGFQAFARIGFDGYLFKAKKLRATIGVEAGYIGSYNLLGYVPMMDTYVVHSGATGVLTFAEMPKLHLFTQYELGFFRWFIRVENIEQSFIKNVNMEAIGYPVVPLQIRMGISWDLFN